MIITHLAKLVYEQAKARGEEVVFRHRNDETKTWIPTTWNEFAKKVKSLANTLAYFGLKEQQRIATYTQNMPEGLIVDFAAYSNRLVVVPLYATSSVDQITYILNDSESQILFVDRKSTRLNAIHIQKSRIPTSA